jgi:hypothetical protein
MCATLALVFALFFACAGDKKAIGTDADGSVTDSGKVDLGDDIGETGGSSIDAGPPQLTASPTSIFLQATATVGDWPAASIVVANPGESATGPLLMSLAGPGSEQFELHRENCPTDLAPGRRCTVFLIFHTSDVPPDPDVGSEAHVTLTIADSGPYGRGLTATVAITVVTIVPSEGLAILGPPDMGKVQLGATGASLSFIVVNTDSSDSGVLQISLSSPQFEKSADLCSGYSLAGGGTCSFAVRLVPADLGFGWAILTVQGSKQHMVASAIVSGNAIGQ